MAKPVPFIAVWHSLYVGEWLKAPGLQGTDLAKAQVNAIRLKLFKVAAIVIKNTRRRRFLLPSHHPYQGVFTQDFQNLNSS